jgi:pimeloyl-ACP methyl ester carboxylesterase
MDAMTPYSHATAPTEFVEVNGARIAFRSFGAENGTPIILLNHYRAGMDHWDPAVTDGLARGRRVILYDYQGVAGSGGEPRDSFEAMGDDAAEFARALGLSEVDVLGFSIGGMIGLGLAQRHPGLVRRLIVVDAKPRNGDTEGVDPSVREVADNPVPVMSDFLFLFFAPSEASQDAGQAFWDRRHLRDDDPPSSDVVMKTQRAATIEWSQRKGERFAELAAISQPTLVVHGHRDIMQPTINAFTMAQRIPQAQLIIYPDSGHGAIFQYPELFVDHASRFLDSERAFS